MATKTTNIKGPAGVQGDPGPVGGPGPTNVSTDSGNQIKLGSDSKLWTPNQFPSLPLATASQAGLLVKVSGSSGDFIDGTNHVQSLAPAVAPIFSQNRLYAHNAINNPNFEVSQRTVSNFADRWNGAVSGPVGTIAKATTVQPGITDPSTGQVITTAYMRFTVTTTKASLAAGDLCYIQQIVEGPYWRPLWGSHSLSLLVRSSVAPVKFGVCLRSVAVSSAYHSLTMLATYTGPAGYVQLLQFPNLPAWDSTATFNATQGAQGYTLLLVVAAGSNWASTANNVWTSGGPNNNNLIAAVGQDNFWANPANSYFDFIFVQHEPGPYCTTLMDIPFPKNLRTCQRYYCRSIGYGQAWPTAGTSYRQLGQLVSGTSSIRGCIQFPVEMALTPTMSWYDYNGATAGTLSIPGMGNYSVSSYTASTHGVQNMTLASAVTATYNHPVAFGQYLADTGW